MICAPIVTTTEQDDGTLAFAASIPIADNPLGADFEETLRVYSSEGGPLREMGGHVAAGRIDELRIDDGRVTVVGRVIDPSSIAKVKRGVLKGVTIGKRFVSLVDRLTTDAEIDLVKGIFWRTFTDEMRKAANMHDPEDDDANQADPARIEDPPDALMAEIAGLRQDARFLRGSPADALAAVRETFRAGPRFGNMFDLRDKIPPPADIWRTMITANDDAMRDALTKSNGAHNGKPAGFDYPMLESNGAAPRPEGSERMRKAQNDAGATIEALHPYAMLRSNSSAPPQTLAKAATATGARDAGDSDFKAAFIKALLAA